MVRLYRRLSLVFFITGCILLGHFASFAQCTITGLASTYCADDANVMLSGGTNYFGPGVSGSTFSPATAGPGTHQIVTTNGSATTYIVNTSGTFSPIAGTGTSVSLADNQVTGADLPIGFTFNFFGVNSSVFRIVSNGFLRFGATGISSTPQSIPNTSIPNNLIALAWADLNPSISGGSIRYFTTGTAPYRKLIVNFTNVAFVSDNTKRVTGQIQLHETTNIIEMHTTQIDSDGTTARTMGIEDSGGNNAYAPAGRNNAVWSATNDFVQFWPTCLDIRTVTVHALPSDLGVAPASATICTGGTADITITNSQSGVSYQLQNNATSAALSTIVPGTGNNLVITSNALTAGTTIKVYAQDNTTLCDRDLTAKAVITVNQVPTTADAGPPTVTQCNVSSFTMSANTATTGTGAWSVLNGAATISSPGLPGTTVTVAAGNTATLRWTISNGSCASSSDDIVLTNHASPSAAVITSGASLTQCNTGTFTISATAPVVGTGTWSVQSGSGTVTNAASATTTVTGVTAGTSTVIRWTVANGACPVNQADITLTNNAATTIADAGPASINQCNVSTFNMSANTGVGTGAWSLVSGSATIGNAALPNTTITVAAGNTATLRWTITNLPCAATFDDIVLTNYAPASAAVAGSDITQCNSGTFTMTATAPVVGSGLWTVQTGTATITNTTSATTTITGVPAGTSAVLRWTVTNGASCPTNQADVTLTNQAATTIADAGPASINQCNVSTFSMSANTGVGTGAWSLVSGSATIGNAALPNTTITVAAGNTATLRWTITNLPCAATFDDIVLTNYAPASAAVTGSNITQCNSGTFTMAATAPVVGTGLWTVQTGTATITNTTSATTTITGVPAGTSAVLRWTVTNGASCTTNQADVTLTNQAATTIADAGPASINQCNVSTFNMSANTGVGTGAWSLVSGSATIGNAALPNTTITVAAGNTATLRWTITNLPCAATFDDIVLTNYAPASAAVTGSNITQCNSGTFTMAATAPVVGTGLWTVQSGTATITNTTSPTTTVTGVPAGTSAVLRWTVTNGASCPTNQADVTLTNQAATTIADAGPASINQCNVSTFSMSANTGVGTGAWSLVSGSATIGNAALPNTTITVAAGNTATLRWTITNLPCAATFDDIILTNYAPASAAVTGSNITQCNSGTFTMAATAPVVGTGLWTVQSGTATITNTTSPTTTVTGVPAGTSAVLRWTVTNGASCATNQADITLTNNAATTIADAGPASINQCNVSTFSMSANTGVGTGAWSLVSGSATIGNAALPNTTITVAAGNTATLRWTITNLPCAATSDDIVLTNYAPASGAVTGSNITQCNSGTFTMAATAPVVGTGLWTVQSGTATITNATLATTTVTGVPAGTSAVLRWTVTNGASCATNQADITLTNNAATTIADAGPASINQCNVSTFSMSANTGVGTGAWSLVSGSATIGNAALPNTTITVAAGNTATLRWTITNLPCAATSDDIVLTNYAPASAAVAGSDITQCNSGTFTMAATAPVVGTGLWTVQSGTATITNATLATTTVTGVPAGTSAVLRWTVTNGASCTTNQADVTLTNQAATTIADAGPASINQCNVSTFSMSANTGVGTGAWSLVSGSATIGNAALPNTTITVAAGNTATLRWTITNLPCAATFDDIVLTNYAPASAAVAGSDITQCNSGTFTMAATAPVVGLGLWTVQSGTATITNATLATTTVTGVPAGTSAVLRWTVTNGASCPTNQADVTLTNQAATTIADAGPASIDQCNVSAFNMSANTGVGTGAWSLVSGSATIGNAALPNTTITVAAGNTATLRWTITNLPCAATFDDIVLTNYAPASAAVAGSDITQCNSGTFTMAATAPVVGTGLWTVQSGTATITNLTSPTTTVTGVPAGTVAVLRWTVTNGVMCSVTQSDVSLTNDALPTVSNAGSDQSICGAATSMAANAPGLGTGSWSVLTGIGGSFALASNPATGFTGTPGNTYVLRWTITNGTCSSADDVLVVLKRIPDASATPQPYTICSGTSTDIQLNNPNGVSGTTFTWTVLSSSNTNGASAASGARITQLLTSADGLNSGTVQYSVTPSSNGCAGAPISVDVTVAPVPVITNAPTTLIREICSGANVNFIPTASVGSTSFTWTSSVIGTLSNVSPTGVGNINDAPVNATSANAVIIYTITPGAGGCDGPKVNVVVTVRPVPKANAADQTICSGQSTSISITDPDVAGTTFSWTVGSIDQVAGYSAGSGNTISQLLTNTSGTANGSLVYQITPSVNGCTGPVRNVTVTVKPVPVVNNTTTALAQQICSGEQLAFTAASNITGATFTWTSSITGPISAGSVSVGGNTAGITDIPLNTGSVNGTVVYRITPHHNGCDGTPVDYIVTVNPLPSATIGSTTICSGEMVTLNIQNTPKSIPGTTFSWTISPSANIAGATPGNGSTISQTLSTTNASIGAVVYTITPSANGCDGPVTLVTVTVNPSVTVNAGPDQVLCEASGMPMPIPVSGTVGGSATSGTWFIKTGTGALSSSTSTGIPSGATVSATYTATSADITAGFIDLYLVTNDPDTGGPCSVKSDTIRIRLNKRPSVVPLTNFVVCEPARIDLAGMIGGSATSGAWSVLTGGGTLSVSSNTIISPGNIRVSATYDTIRSDVGQVLMFRLTTNDTDGTGPCVPRFRDIQITVNESAKVNAGPDFEVCQDEQVNLNGVLGGTTSSVTWTGASGTFNNVNNPTTFYTLTPADINAVPAPGASSIVLRLTTNDPDGAGPTGPCLAAHDEVNVKINKLPVVNFFNLLPSYAENSPFTDLAGAPAGGIFTGHGIVAGTSRFEPDNAGTGVVIIRYTYTDPLTGCDNFAEQATIVNPVTNVTFDIQQPSGVSNGDFVICENSGPGGFLSLLGNPDPATGQNPTKFESDSAVLQAKIVQAGSTFKINTVGLRGGRYPIRYIYTNSVNATDTLTRFIVVNSAPKALIGIDKACLVEMVIFSDSSKIRNNTSGATIVAWDWNYGDGNGNDNTSSRNPSYKYGAFGTYNISLRVTTDQGCSHDTTGTIRVGKPPKVDFNQTKICSGDVTKFKDESEPYISQIVSYAWDFDDLDTLGFGAGAKGIAGSSMHSGRTSGTYKNPNHKYQDFRQYNVTLRVWTDDGCEADTTKRIYILDYNAPQPTMGYKETFENGPGTWVKGDLNTSNSWLFTKPFGDVINSAASGDSAWWTGANSTVGDRATYFKNEKSEVIGPCLDISGLKRPMISLDYWSDLEQGFDGAVVQYSRDGGLSWETIGNAEGNGIEWYNSRDVSGRPGSQNNYAWSSEANAWRNARYNLDQIPINDRDTVVFKIAFGSNGDNPADRIRNGFAFDNVYIGEKMRTVMVEHFTNSQDVTAVSANTVLDELYDAQVATDLNGPGKKEPDFFKIEYHLDVDGPDVLNLENPGDPRARAFYYGISEAPRTVMDGITGEYYGTRFDGDYSRITAIQTDKRALEDPMFTIDIDTVDTGNNHRVKLNLTFHYIDSLRNYREPVVFQAALVETDISVDGGTFRNVVRKLLVNGNQGQTVSQFTWDYRDPAANTLTIPVDYELDVPVRNPGKLYIAVFAHERGQDARRILQSRLVKIQRKVGPRPVGIPDDPAFAEISGLRVYPNPASQVLNLELDDNLSQDYVWSLVDQRGITVLSGGLNRDLTKPQSLPVGGLANGIYFLQIGTAERKIYYRKVAVMNRN